MPRTFSDVTINKLKDDAFREEVAAESYYRERVEDAALAQELDVDDDDTAYYALHWDSLSDDARRPYRTAVHQAFERVLELEAA